ncbi:MAG: 2-enoate reductase, partial [Firmicutes bacterium]|nr:2-enoate reductase [Bacillota bacterium]
MDPKYSPLFQPITIGNVTLKNRVILCAMGGTSPFGHDSNSFVPEIGDYYRDRARGGVALIIPGVTQIKNGSHFLYEYEDIFMGPLKKVVEDLHSYGTKFFLQIGAGFGRTQFYGVD